MMQMPGAGGLGGAGGGNLGTIWAGFGLDTSALSRGGAEARGELRAIESEAEEALGRLGSRATEIGTMMTMGLTAPLAGFALVSINAAAQFDQAMARVQAVTGEMGPEFDELRDVAREMGRETSFTATEAAQGLEYLGRAGWEVHDMVEGTEPILRLAEATMTDLGRTSDIVSDIMTAFQIPAEEAVRTVDVLAEVTRTANTDLAGLGATMAYAAPTAAALGLDMDEVAAAAGRLADAGIKGSRAGTALDAVFRDLSTMSEAATEELARYNIELLDSDDNMRDLTDILADYEAELDGASDAHRTHVLRLGFTDRALRGFQTLLAAGSDELQSYTDSIRDSDGAVEEMGDAIRDDLRYELTRLRSVMNSILIDVGTALIPVVRGTLIPALESLGDMLSGLSSAFADLDPPMQGVILSLGVMVAAIGPVLTLIGRWLRLNASLIVSAGGVKAAIAAKAGALATLAATTPKVTFALAAMGAALAVLGPRILGIGESTRDLSADMDRYLERGERLQDLVDRYDELTAETELTNEQQQELRDTMEEIARLVPEAVEGWDDHYGAIEVNIGAVERLADEYHELAERVMELRIQEQRDQLAEVEAEYTKVEDHLQAIDDIYQDINAVMEAQRDKVMTVTELEEIREGLTREIMDLLYVSADNWWDGVRAVSQFNERLMRGDLTLADIGSMVLDIGDRWEALGVEVDEQEDRLDRMKETLSEIRGEVDLQAKSTEELKELQEEVAQAYDDAADHGRLMSMIAGQVSTLTGEAAEEGKVLGDVIMSMVRYWDMYEDDVQSVKGEYGEILDLVSRITGWSEDQRITIDDVREILSETEGELTGHLQLYKEIAELLEDRLEDKEDAVEVDRELLELQQLIHDVLQDMEDRLDVLRTRSAAWGEDLDLPAEKIEEIHQAIEELIDEGLSPTRVEIRQLVERIIEFAEEVDDTDDATDLLRQTFDTLAESGANLESDVLQLLIKAIGDVRREVQLLDAELAERPFTAEIERELEALERLEDTVLDIDVQAEQLRLLERAIRTVVTAENFEERQGELRRLTQLYIEHGGTIEDVGEIADDTGDRRKDLHEDSMEMLEGEELQMGETGKALGEGIEEGVDAAELSMEEALGSLDQFRMGIIAAADDITISWVEVGRTLHTELSRAFSDILQDIENAEDAMLSFLDRMAAYIIDMFAQVAAYHALQQIAGLALPGMSFPMFQRGGKVQGLSSEEQLIYAHGQEWVVPNEIMGAIQGALASPSAEEIAARQQTPNIDYDRLGRAVGKHINSASTTQVDIHEHTNITAMDAASFNEYVKQHPDGVKSVIMEDLQSNSRLQQLIRGLRRRG